MSKETLNHRFYWVRTRISLQYACVNGSLWRHPWNRPQAVKSLVQKHQEFSQGYVGHMDRSMGLSKLSSQIKEQKEPPNRSEENYGTITVERKLL